MTTATANRPMFTCTDCHGEGFVRIMGGGRFSDWRAIPCRTCNQTGKTVATDAEMAELDEMTARIDAAIQAELAQEAADLAATVAAVADFLGVNVSTPVTPVAEVAATGLAITHSGMTAAWFDQAVQRSFEKGVTLSISSTRDSAVVTSENGIYWTTRETCTCLGHEHAGHCYHRARLIAELDVFAAPVAVAA